MTDTLEMPALLDISPEIEAILDEIDRRNAEEEARRQQSAMWVCLGHGIYGCGQTFVERPTLCPRCGKDHSLRR